jgi:hypothetical protein
VKIDAQNPTSLRGKKFLQVFYLPSDLDEIRHRGCARNCENQLCESHTQPFETFELVCIPTRFIIHFD